nr:hypothetical protein [Pantoea vagans]
MAVTVLLQVVTAEMGGTAQAPGLKPVTSTINIIKVHPVAPMVETVVMADQQITPPAGLAVMEVTMTRHNICKRCRTLLRCSTLLLAVLTHYGYASSAYPSPFSASLSLISDGGNGGDGGDGGDDGGDGNGGDGGNAGSGSNGDGGDGGNGGKTAEMVETEVMVTDQVMAETAAMPLQAASAVRVAAAGVREDMMVLPG